MPSRQFLIQQATLTTLFRWFPSTIKLGGRRFAAEGIAENLEDGEDDELARLFRRAVIREYRILEARYS